MLRVGKLVYPVLYPYCMVSLLYIERRPTSGGTQEASSTVLNEEGRDKLFVAQWLVLHGELLLYVASCFGADSTSS
jgi:hypothetical protein